MASTPHSIVDRPDGRSSGIPLVALEARPGRLPQAAAQMRSSSLSDRPSIPSAIASHPAVLGNDAFSQIHGNRRATLCIAVTASAGATAAPRPRSPSPSPNSHSAHGLRSVGTVASCRHVSCHGRLPPSHFATGGPPVRRRAGTREPLVGSGRPARCRSRSPKRPPSALTKRLGRHRGRVDRHSAAESTTRST